MLCSEQSCVDDGQLLSSESKGFNPLVALKREQANFLNFTIKMTRF